MEDVRPILVNQESAFVVVVVRVATDMRTFVDDEHPLAAVRGKTLRHDATREARPDDQVVEHLSLPAVFRLESLDVPRFRLIHEQDVSSRRTSDPTIDRRDNDPRGGATRHRM